MSDASDRQAQQYDPVNDPARPEYYRARGLPLPAWLGGQPAPAPAPAAPRAAAPPPSGPAPLFNAASTDPHEQHLATVADLYRRILGRDPTGAELSRNVGLMESNHLDPGTLGLALIQAHRTEIARGAPGRPGLSDDSARERFRALTTQFGQQSEAAGLANLGANQGNGDQPGRQPLTAEQYRAMLDPNTTVGRTLQKIPAPFLGGPDVLVHPDEVDTPEELSRFLQSHGGDTRLNRDLLQAALNYGGLSIEPTPYGTANRAGGNFTQWYRKSDAPGDQEQRLMQLYGQGGSPSPADLAAVAQEREGAYRLRDPNQLLHQATKALGAGIFGTATGYLAGPLIGALGAAAGIPGTVAGVGGAGASSGALGGLASVGSGAAGGAAGSAFASRGDPKATLIGAATGGVGGGLNYALPTPTNAGSGALRGIGVSGARDLVGQALGGNGIDWTRFLQSAGTGAAGGAVSGGPQAFPGENILTGLGASTGNTLLGSRDPFSGVNAQIDRSQLTAEQDRAAALQAAQDRWKSQYAAASAEARAAALEQMRAAQQEFEQRRAEYMAKLQGFLDARQAQIAEALRTMGLAEPGIASVLAEHQKAVDAQRAEEQQQQAALVESRNFFPSELLSQTGDTGASGVLVPHSPPPVLFGQEGLPASFTDYAQAGPPEFSAEGFLPSGSLAGSPPPAVAPMTPTARAPRYFPTLLNGLTRSPYLRYA